MDELKVLILGDGLLGSEIEKQTNWDCFSRKRKNFSIDTFTNTIPPKKYNVIINCIANTDTYSENREAHWETNCVFLRNLIDFCNTNEIKLIHISSDYVYTNSVENVSEDEVPVHCRNWYGYTKLLGDGIVQLYSNSYLLIRCSHKPYPFPYEKGWVDQIGNFDYVNVIADLIIKSIKINLFGVYNLGTEPKSIYNLALKTKFILPIESPSFVPKNITMNIEKLKKKLNEKNR